MSKVSTVSSLIRLAARTEEDFINVTRSVLEDGNLEVCSEYFDRLNIPRSVGSESNQMELPYLAVTSEQIGTFEEEQAISQGIQKFLERHERKIKWHTTHPSEEGIDNVLLLVRATAVLTDMRLRRLHLLLRKSQVLTPGQWAIAREMMNRAFLGFRNFLSLLVLWMDAVKAVLTPETLTERVGAFHRILDAQVQLLEEHSRKIEDRRLELTIEPERYPPVKPPVYFGGDLLGPGPWRQYWDTIERRAHRFRESLA
ncbi:MAG: hypothetical protein JXX28_05050 [Deltaproteobacteria bacterium]|nr:hypothetical protein [Deltaproteobacteria bacterium]